MATVTETRITDREYAVEVDTALAAFWDAETDLSLPLQQAVSAVFRVAGMDPIGTTYSRWQTPKPQGTLDQALQCVESLLRPERLRPWDARDAAEVIARWDTAYRAVQAVVEAQEPFNGEYREVRWTRAFLVLNTGGHVHKDRDCSTCFPTTRYGWLPELSGSSEAEIVEAAGADACTVCYPSAPVESLSRPRTVLHRTEQEAQVAREARAVAKAERDAKKAAKTLSPPVRVFDYHIAERQYQNRDGSIKVTPAHDRFETLETVYAAKQWLTDSQEGYGTPKRPEDIAAVAEALATKFDTTPEAEIAAAAKRAAKRK